MSHPITAAGPAPAVDIAGLARLFATPVLSGEFSPSSYWCCVDLVWPCPEPVADDGRGLAAHFADAVAHACTDADTVAVALSGGLDSAAVLWHVLRLIPARRVLAFTVNLVDDSGASAGTIVAHLLNDLDLRDRVHLRIVEPAACIRQPDWSPYGPRLDALPAVNATVAQLAADAGAQVLLSGNGADELLAVPRYAVIEVARAHGAAAARRYLADMARAGHGRTGEAASVVSHLLAPATRTRMYAAVTWPDWCNPRASPVLSEPWRDEAVTWARRWVDSVLEAHAAHRHSWAQSDAHDAWWPRAYLPPAGPMEEASPFCDSDFASAVLGRSLGGRYEPMARSAYQRVKGGVTALFPDEMARHLPTRKRYYSRALSRSSSGPIDVHVAAQVGLFDAAQVAACSDTATRMMVAAVESWLRGAVAAGANLCTGISAPTRGGPV